MKSRAGERGEAPRPGLNSSPLGQCTSHQLLPHLLNGHCWRTSLALALSHSPCLSGHEGVVLRNVTYPCQRNADTSQSTAAFSPSCPSCCPPIRRHTHTHTHNSSFRHNRSIFDLHRATSVRHTDCVCGGGFHNLSEIKN